MMMINTLRQETLEKFNHAEHQVFKPGELIVPEANYYWLLHQGKVKSSTWTEEGTPVTLGYWGVNDLIHEPFELVRPYQVECLTQVKAEQISLEETSNIIHLIQKHIQQTEEILYILRSERAYQRLCLILNWLCQKFGQKVKLGTEIDLRLTHQDLAALIGTTRVTITKLINQLEQEQFLSRPQRNIIIIHQR